MEFTKEIFDRTNLQGLRSLLLDGADNFYENKTYRERLKNAEKPVKELLDKMVPPNERENAMDIIYDYAALTQYVYMEIGMQCGARLIAQLLL